MLDSKSSSDQMLDKEQSRVDKKKAAKPELPGLPPKHETDARLRSFIERIERIEGEKAELTEDIKEIYGESKANGYDPKIMRKIVRMRKMDVEKRHEEDALIEVYKNAVGLD